MAQGAERLRADGGVDWEGFDWFFMGGVSKPIILWAIYNDWDNK